MVSTSREHKPTTDGIATAFDNIDEHGRQSAKCHKSQAREEILSELIDTGLQYSHGWRGKWGLVGDGEVEKWGWVGKTSLKQYKTLGRMSERGASVQQHSDGGSHKYCICILR